MFILWFGINSMYSLVFSQSKILIFWVNLNFLWEKVDFNNPGQISAVGHKKMKIGQTVQKKTWLRVRLGSRAADKSEPLLDSNKIEDGQTESGYHKVSLLKFLV